MVSNFCDEIQGYGSKDRNARSRLASLDSRGASRKGRMAEVETSIQDNMLVQIPGVYGIAGGLGVSIRREFMCERYHVISALNR